jgi:protein-disulfide isomerase
MFCIVSFVVLGILGIFSASNRQLARESLDCVLRRVTLRPCNTGFDEKMKAKILGFVIVRSESGARLLNRFFEPLSWVFFVLLMASSIWSVHSLYLFYTTGSCNGLNQTGFCVFDPKGSSNQVSGLVQTCKVNPPTQADLTLKDVDLSGFPVLNAENPDKIVFIGCYHCDYTRATYPLVRKLVERYPSSFTFLHYPVKESTDYMTRLGQCAYQQNQAKYWKMNDVFFAADKANLDDMAWMQTTLSGLGFDMPKLNVCVAAPQTEETAKKQMAEIVKTKFFGTPTVFINGEATVGPKPYRVYAILLRGLFYWLR